eukprot:2068542-Pyramimonas_sp.AAC.1
MLKRLLGTQETGGGRGSTLGSECEGGTEKERQSSFITGACQRRLSMSMIGFTKSAVMPQSSQSS